LTIDERLEKLTERHEALTLTVELMAIENKERDRRQAEIMEGLASLVHVAEIHEARDRAPGEADPPGGQIRSHAPHADPTRRPRDGRRAKDARRPARRQDALRMVRQANDRQPDAEALHGLPAEAGELKAGIHARVRTAGGNCPIERRELRVQSSCDQA
jgi:hypothetical protein